MDGASRPVDTVDFKQRRVEAQSNELLNSDHLTSLLLAMTRGWREGRQPAAVDILAQRPELLTTPQAVVGLVLEEVRLRQAHGLITDPADYLRQFPHMREQLEAAFSPPPGAPSRVPYLQANDYWYDFRIVAELGAGAHGRVYVACQPTLADRPMVLKITVRDGEEHLSLARLLQSNIVPLYALYDDPARCLRTLCMPYLGGVTLEHAIRYVRSRSVADCVRELFSIR